MFHSKYFLISDLLPSMIHDLIRSVLFGFQILGDFQLSFCCYWLIYSIMVRKYFICMTWLFPDLSKLTLCPRICSICLVNSPCTFFLKCEFNCCWAEGQAAWQCCSNLLNLYWFVYLFNQLLREAIKISCCIYGGISTISPHSSISFSLAYFEALLLGA